MKVEKKSFAPDETFEIASELAATLQKGVLVGLSGEMGVGKTHFAKGFAAGLEVKDLITSPTFLGISESRNGRLPFIHMDFYKKVASLEIIEKYLANNSVVLIEWIENYKQVFSRKLEASISVYIQYCKDSSGNILEWERQIVIDNSL